MSAKEGPRWSTVDVSYIDTTLKKKKHTQKKKIGNKSPQGNPPSWPETASFVLVPLSVLGWLKETNGEERGFHLVC